MNGQCIERLIVVQTATLEQLVNMRSLSSWDTIPISELFKRTASVVGRQLRCSGRAAKG
jgi:hypothetical protein